MVRGIYSSASGMQYLQLKQSVTANNIANLNTTGFKRQGVFRKTVSDAQQLARQHYTDFVNLEEVDEIRTIHEPGTYTMTNSPLDIAIEGPPFLVVQTPQGERYTGSFEKNASSRFISCVALKICVVTTAPSATSTISRATAISSVVVGC